MKDTPNLSAKWRRLADIEERVGQNAASQSAAMAYRLCANDLDEFMVGIRDSLRTAADNGAAALLLLKGQKS